MSNQKVDGAVAVCTRKADDYIGTLNYSTLINQVIRANTGQVEVVLLIVDNSIEGPGTEAELNLQPNTGLVHEPQIGIPYARNAALKWAKNSSQEWLAFIDDDVSPSENWLNEMREALEKPETDCVQGPLTDHYPSDYSEDLPKMDGFSFTVGEQLITASTHNIIFKTEKVWDLGIWFNSELAESGGSDTEFFLELSSRGFSIGATDKVLAIEIIEGERATLRWHLRRMIRVNQSWFLARDRVTKSNSAKYGSRLTKSISKGFKASTALIFSSFVFVANPKRNKKRFLYALFNFMPVVAFFSYKLGVRIREYKMR